MHVWFGVQFTTTLAFGLSLSAHALVSVLTPPRPPAVSIERPMALEIIVTRLQKPPEATKGAAARKRVVHAASAFERHAHARPAREARAGEQAKLSAWSTGAPGQGSRATGSNPSTIDLSPHAAARAGLADQAPPVPERPAGRRDGSSTGHEPSLAERVDAMIRGAARNTALSRAPDPMLEHGEGGGYTFRGASFDARIDPDGQVHFVDKYKRGRSVDFNALAERAAGNDPYRSERRWFLERTAELRAALERSQHEAIARLSLAELSRALLAIWTVPGLPDAIRRQRTLALWDASGRGAQRARARAGIEAFVRERCPAASSCGFTAEELHDFNQGRGPDERFDPYEPASGR